MARLEIYLMFNYNNHTIMNKTEFISAVAAKAGLTKVDAKKAVDAFIDTVAEEMKNVFRTMPDSEEAGEYRDWLGLEKDEIWSADTFNLDEINADLKEV